MRGLSASLLVATLVGCASDPPGASPEAPPPPPAPAPVTEAPAPVEPAPAPSGPPAAAEPSHETARAPIDVFPHVRLLPDERAVEIDGFVPIVADPDAPDVYLELVMCRRDSREHESLVATDAKASHIHAALLLLELEPGQPGRWSVDADGALVSHAPEGPEVVVTLHWTDAAGVEREARPREWVVNLMTGERFPEGAPGVWRFAGSMETKHPMFPYAADGSGNIVGLTTFGDEVIAWSNVISPESSIDEPVWGADFDRVPAFGTEVRVRVGEGTKAQGHEGTKGKD